MESDTHAGEPFWNSSNIERGTSPRAPVIGLWASYHAPSLFTSLMTWKKSPFSNESSCGADDLYEDKARMTRFGGIIAFAGLEREGNGAGVEMWWGPSLAELRDFLSVFIMKRCNVP